ncbi:MAG: hypothetical protein HZB76_01575 [Chlamydiae bacterium]|nr:hypothetical protein [Chlamydiota bacterium]
MKVITRFSQLESREKSIEPEDIIVAHRTENSWSQFFTTFKGIVSMEGNPTAHPMLIAREHGVPCVIGVKDAVDVFSPYDGQIVTIDGFRKKVYLGAVPAVEVPLSRISELFEAVTPEILPTMSELVAEATKKGKMFTDEAGKAWFVKPDSIMSGSLLELQLASFAIRDGLLNRAGATPPISIVGEQQVIGGKVYEKLLGSLQEQVNVLNRLTLEQFETYSHQEEVTIRNYLSICQHFTPTVDQWHAFCNSYREVCAYMWLSFSTRTSKLDHMFRIAHELEIPKIYFSECEAQIQAGTFEEDVAFKKDMNKLREKLFGFYTKEELRAISIDSLRASHPDLYNDLIYVARQYKFTPSSDWKVEIPFSVVLERLLNTATLLDRGAVETAMTSSDFFVDNPELLRWTMLGTKSKIQQNNSHHQILRGQWFVREKLLNLGQTIISILRGQWFVREKLLNLGQTIISRTSGSKIDFEALDDKGHKIRKPFLSPTDILDASVEQVEMFIVQFSSLS